MNVISNSQHKAGEGKSNLRGDKRGDSTEKVSSFLEDPPKASITGKMTIELYSDLPDKNRANQVTKGYLNAWSINIEHQLYCLHTQLNCKENVTSWLLVLIKVYFILHLLIHQVDVASSHHFKSFMVVMMNSLIVNGDFICTMRTDLFTVS